jgi:hypothetical protein
MCTTMEGGSHSTIMLQIILHAYNYRKVGLRASDHGSWQTESWVPQRSDESIYRSVQLLFDSMSISGSERDPFFSPAGRLA